jgi:hypothetical protein
MKQMEREMKGEEANATDDEVCFARACHVALPDICRTMFSHPPIQMNPIMLLRIVLAQSTLHVAELTLKLTESSRMT